MKDLNISLDKVYEDKNLEFDDLVNLLSIDPFDIEVN